MIHCLLAAKWIEGIFLIVVLFYNQHKGVVEDQGHGNSVKYHSGHGEERRVTALSLSHHVGLLIGRSPPLGGSKRP